MDRRDPQHIGEIILSRDKEHYPSASEFVDAHLHKYDIREIDPGESTCTSTQRQYRDELYEAAMSGDSHARQRLADIDPALFSTLPRVNRVARDNHRAYVDDERDTRTITNSGLDRNGDAVPSAFDDPDPGDADKVQPGELRLRSGRCLASYESMGGPLHRCIMEEGHPGPHSSGFVQWQ